MPIEGVSQGEYLLIVAIFFFLLLTWPKIKAALSDFFKDDDEEGVPY